MTEIASASIYSLPYSAVPTSEDSILIQVLAELHELREEVFRLREENQELRASIQTIQEQSIDHLALEIAMDRKRITALEKPPEPSASEKTKAHIDEIYRLMRSDRLHALPLSRAAKLIGVSKSRMKQLKGIIAKDERFEIIRDPHHKQRLLIKLRTFGGR